ncbi:MAG: PD-(D/E)XK nuclease family protein, partial [Bacteroidaceae bacterium]
MEYFLKTVAKDLYKQFGNDLSHIAVVFPNKRASLFFNEYLADEAKKAIWSPAYLSISELFCQSANTKLGDSVKLVCELYKIFCKETKSKETLDDFYFWGELLISDFDDIDKNLVDANRLFSNLQDLKGIMDDYEFLDKEQEEAIQQFFQNFSIEHRTVLKERFISLWNVLGNIYTNYKETLSQQGIAYEGMLYRSMIEQIQIDKLPYNKYVFVGFNVLNKVENKLFQVLRDANKALFYWDYDTFYLNNANHEAGEFIKRNLHEFPSSLSAELFNTLSKPKNIRYIAASTENAQARFLPTWIKETHMEHESESAVVLCNEALLLPVLHCIPSSIENVNITMGFPLSQTPICSFINALLDMQTIGYNPTSGRYTYATVIAALKHPYTRQLSKESELLERGLTQSNRFYPLPSELKKDDFLSFLFTPQLSNLNLCEYLIEVVKTVAQVYQKGTNSANDVLNQLYRESLFKVYTTISRFKTLIEAGDLIVEVDTFRKLLDKVLTSSNIPFHGEPAIGMQIMGVLETRNLDFKNLLLLSLNEGQL